MSLPDCKKLDNICVRLDTIMQREDRHQSDGQTEVVRSCYAVCYKL